MRTRILFLAAAPNRFSFSSVGTRRQFASMSIEFSPKTVLNFWFREIPQEKWFGGDAKFNSLLKERFSSWNQLAHERKLDTFKTTPHGALSLILLLDQMNRNIYHGTPGMFRSDDYCLELVDYSLQHNFEQSLLMDDTNGKEKVQFLLLPLMHAEDEKRQDLLLKKIDDWELLDYYKKFALLHRQDIIRFGRFPSRNSILQRESSEEELDYLNDPNSWFAAKPAETEP